MRPKLSICMIVKDEEGNLKRCLDSFLPIIHEPWCELIIVDTGSSDRTLEVAKEYTDKVFEKKWDPWDFAAARNFANAQAIGEKIMTVDADEELSQRSLYILEDIILNPAYDECPTVFIMLHNFYTADFKLYSNLLQPRIFKNDGEPIYESDVHNRPRSTPPYLFADNVIFNHYGYQFQGKSDLYDKKTDRTMSLMLKRFKKDPTDIHILTHLAKGYRVMNDWDNTIRYGELWIEQMKEAPYDEGWISFLEVLVNMIEAYIVKNDIENAERIREVAEGYSKRLSSMYIILGNFYASADQPDQDKAYEYFKKALDIYEGETNPYDLLISNNSEMVMPEIINWIATYHFWRREYELAGEYMQKGILANENRLPLRWDIFNEEKAQANLIR